MKLVTLLEALPLTFNKSASSRSITLDAMRPYVLSDSHFQKVAEHVIPRAYRISRYEGRLRPFVARQNRGDRVLFYTGAGGYGDQILGWPVAKALHKLGYKVHILSDPGNELCWANFPWVEAIYTMPVEQRHIEMFENLALFEVVTNNDEHDDQLHPVDNLMMRMGIDPNSVSPDHKVVKPVVTPLELKKAHDIVKGRAVGIYQLATTSPLRSLTPALSADLFAALARGVPEITWFGFHDRFNEKDYVEAATSAIGALPNAALVEFKEFRVIFAVTGLARVVVTPDSFMAHLAGACGVPTVGMWGATHPSLRVRYYQRHTPIWARNACSFSPCLRTVREFPSYCPPSAEPRKMCAVMGAISPDEVVAAVRKSLHL